jgi:hypothetical protein
MDLTHSVGLPGVEQDPLSRRGFAGVNVRGNSNITNPLYVSAIGHKKQSPLGLLRAHTGNKSRPLSGGTYPLF